MMKNFKIIFMGTPDFAVESLKALCLSDFKIVAVITAPDKPKGRGRKLIYSPVKKFALEQKIDVLQPKNLKSKNFVKKLHDYDADLQIVVAFRILPKIIFTMPKYGSINLHASLLPDYRGAAPINWVLINGEKTTGITTFFINEKIDNVKIIFSEKIKIKKNENAGTLHDRLMSTGSKLVIRTVNEVLNKSYTTSNKNSKKSLKIAPKINKEFCQITLNKKAQKIINHIRGLSPYPCAWIKQNNKIYKIYSAKLLDKKIRGPLGKMFIYIKKYVILNNNYKESISITRIQMEGKKEMKTSEFIKGNTL